MTHSRFGLRSAASYTVLANRVTLSRLFLVVVLASTLFLDGEATTFVQLILLVLIWTTDLLDGLIARRGFSRGAESKPAGMVADSVIDDVAYVVGFVVLASNEMVSVWVIAVAAISRNLLTTTRIVAMAQGSQYPEPRQTGKYIGALIASTQIGLAAFVAFSGATELSSSLKGLFSAGVTALFTFAAVDFLLASRLTWKRFVEGS